MLRKHKTFIHTTSVECTIFSFITNVINIRNSYSHNVFIYIEDILQT